MALSASTRRLRRGAEALDELTCICRLANHRIGEEADRQALLDVAAHGHLLRLAEDLADLWVWLAEVEGEVGEALRDRHALLTRELTGLRRQYALLQESHDTVRREQRAARAQWRRLGAMVELTANAGQATPVSGAGRPAGTRRP